MSKHILSAVLAFLLALCLLALGWASPFLRLGGNATGFLTGLGEKLADAQQADIHRAIDDLAERYGFDAAAVEALADAEALRALREEAAAWYGALLSEDFEGEDPYVSLDGLEDVIYSDPGFQEAVEPALWRSVARDEAAPAVEKALKDALYPVRPSLLGMARSMADSRVDVPELLAKAPRYLVYGIAVALVLCAALLILHRKRLWGFAKWLGIAVAAAGCMGCALALLIWLLRVPQQAAEVSQIGALACKEIFAALRPWLAWLPLGAFVLGEACVWFAARKEAQLP